MLGYVIRVATTFGCVLVRLRIYMFKLILRSGLVQR